MAETTEVLVWRRAQEFGGYLRGLRKAQGLTLRVASESVSLSFTRLQKLETNGRVKQPPLDLLRQLASLYNRPVAEMFAKAGLSVRGVVEDDHDVIDRRFCALVLHPALCPLGMDVPHWLGSFSTTQKSQWIDFALRLESAVREGLGLEELLEIEEDIEATP